MTDEIAFADAEIEKFIQEYEEQRAEDKREVTPVLVMTTPREKRLVTLEGELASIRAHQESKRLRSIDQARDRQIVDRTVTETPQGVLLLDRLMLDYFEILPTSTVMLQFKGRFLSKRLKQLNRTALPYEEVDKVIKAETHHIVNTVMDGHIILALWYAACYCGQEDLLTVNDD
jgi:hypothetical protein